MIKYFIFLTLAGSLLRKYLKRDTITLWQSLRPVSIKLVSWKCLGLFVSITSIDVPFYHLTQVTPFTRLEREKVSHKSGKWLCVCPFLSRLILKSPIMSIFSYFQAILHNDLVNSVKMLPCCCYMMACKETLNTVFHLVW